MDREVLGQIVRAAWVAWANEQPDPKSSWLVSWEKLNESDKEADRCIGEAVREAIEHDMRAHGFAAFVSVGGMELEQRIAELEDRQTRYASHLEETQELIDQLKELLDRSKRQDIKTGQLAPLSKALAYHHQMAMGWARLAATADLDEFPAFEELHREFQKMYKVVTHYEYVAQGLLGINPSPGADLE